MVGGALSQGCFSGRGEGVVEEIMVLIKHGISKARGSLEDAMYFLRRRKTDVSLY